MVLLASGTDTYILFVGQREMDNNMSEDTKYNGWTNYATWRIQLELIEDYVRTMAEDWDTSTEGQRSQQNDTQRL